MDGIPHPNKPAGALTEEAGSGEVGKQGKGICTCGPLECATRGLQGPLDDSILPMLLDDWSQLDLQAIEQMAAHIRAAKARYVATALGQEISHSTLRALDTILIKLYTTRDVLCGREDSTQRAAFYEALVHVQETVIRTWPSLHAGPASCECGRITEPLPQSDMAAQEIASVDEVSQGVPPAAKSSRTRYTLTEEAEALIRRFVQEHTLGTWGTTRTLAEQLGVPEKIALRWVTRLGLHQPAKRRGRSTSPAEKTEEPKRLQSPSRDANPANQEPRGEEELAATRAPPTFKRAPKKTALLTADEERALATQVRAGGEAAREARERFVQANQGLVFREARRYARSDELSISLEDLLQEGNIGLLRAIESYDPDKGRFSTHATWWIRQAVIRACEEKGRAIRLPAHVHQQLRNVRRAQSRLREELKQEPTPEALAKEAQLSPSQLTFLSRLPATLSLEQSLTSDDEDDYRLRDHVADVSIASPEETAVSSFFAEEVRSALEEVLTPRELYVIELRFGMGMDEKQTLAHAGKELGVSRERIRQIQEHAIEKLRRSPEISALWA